LPIIGLMSFLVGIVIAQQGAVQLRAVRRGDLHHQPDRAAQFARTGRADDRDHGGGPLGLAFAAQIGTMKLTEEIDAMRTIGVSPMEALVVPRVLAAIHDDAAAGLLAAIWRSSAGRSFRCTLGIPFFTFLRIQEVVPSTTCGWA
jgi:phospholipid/cholesterol/gamma-HCH transport system permease protein